MLSVIFPTFNGADTLPLMLESMCQLQSPEGGWRLIAVNNGSSDETLTVLRSYEGRLPLRIMQQAKPGKSRALNTAIPEIEGDLTVFTDDDVLPDTNWLVAWRQFTDTYPEFGVFGGRITPHWLTPPPTWVMTSIPHGIAYAKTHDNVTTGKTSPRNIAGPNMAIRNVYLDRGLRFNEAAGPTGTAYAMGEDTAFAYQAEAGGAKPAHCGTAQVSHIILPKQYSRLWLLRRAYRYGQSVGYSDKRAQRHRDDQHILSIPRWLFREYIGHHTRALASSFNLNAHEFMKAAWDARYTAGYLRGYRGTLLDDSYK